MKRLEPSQISATFNSQMQRFTTMLEKSNAGAALEDLSRAIADIRDAGYDVALTLFGTPSEQAFDLFPGSNGLIVPISGVLRIGPIEHLVGLAVEIDKLPALKLGVSEFDIRFQGTEGSITNNVFKGTVRQTIYDLKGDPEALVKLQTEIIRHCARNDYINDRDVANGFDNNARLRKAGPRLLPKAS